MDKMERLERILAENLIQTALLRKQMLALLSTYGETVLREDIEASCVFLDAYSVMGACEAEIPTEVARAIHTLELSPTWQPYLEARTQDWFKQFWGEVDIVLKSHQNLPAPLWADD